MKQAFESEVLSNKNCVKFDLNEDDELLNKSLKEIIQMVTDNDKDENEDDEDENY